MKQIFTVASLFCVFFMQEVQAAPPCDSECREEINQEEASQKEISQELIHRALSARPLTYQDSDVREAPEADEAYSWPGRRESDFYDGFTR